MTTFAVMSGNFVSNVIVADSKEIAEEATGTVCIEYDEINQAGLGWSHDGEKFNPPTLEEPTND